MVGLSAAGHGGLSKRHFHKHHTEILNLEIGERTPKTFFSHEPFLKPQDPKRYLKLEMKLLLGLDISVTFLGVTCNFDLSDLPEGQRSAVRQERTTSLFCNQFLLSQEEMKNISISFSRE